MVENEIITTSNSIKMQMIIIGWSFLQSDVPWARKKLPNLPAFKEKDSGCFMLFKTN